MALITGVVAERGRLLPFLVFAIVWTTLVYDPIAYWYVYLAKIFVFGTSSRRCLHLQNAIVSNQVLDLALG